MQTVNTKVLALGDVPNISRPAGLARQVLALNMPITIFTPPSRIVVPAVFSSSGTGGSNDTADTCTLELYVPGSLAALPAEDLAELAPLTFDAPPRAPTSTRTCRFGHIAFLRPHFHESPQ